MTGRGADAGWAIQLFALTGGVAAWAIHLVGLAALAAPACEHGLTWIQHALTGVTAVITIGSIAAGARLLPARGHGDARPGAEGPVSGERTRFLGFLAIAFGVASLALILLEGLPVAVINACRTA